MTTPPTPDAGVTDMLCASPTENVVEHSLDDAYGSRIEVKYEESDGYGEWRAQLFDKDGACIEGARGWTREQAVGRLCFTLFSVMLDDIAENERLTAQLAAANRQIESAFSMAQSLTETPIPEKLHLADVIEKYVVRGYEEQLAAAKADGERLDFLEDERVFRASYYPMDRSPHWRLEGTDETKGATLRKAIDAARTGAR